MYFTYRITIYFTYKITIHFNHKLLGYPSTFYVHNKSK